MNNYLKILDYLNQFAGSGEYHPLSNYMYSLFNGGEQSKIAIRCESLLSSLEQDGLIQKRGSFVGGVEFVSRNKLGPLDITLPQRYFRDSPHVKRNLWQKIFTWNYRMRIFSDSPKGLITPIGISYLKHHKDHHLPDSKSSEKKKKKETIDFVKECLKKGNLSLGMDQILKIATSKSLEDKLFMLYGRFYRIMDDWDKGTISIDYKSIELNRVSESLFRVLEELEDI